MEVGLVVERGLSERVVVIHPITGEVLMTVTLVAVRKNRVARIGFKADKAKFKILREELVGDVADG